MSINDNNNIDSLTSGRILARNTISNLIAQGMPLLVAIFSVPILISKMGIDRFGILSIVWVIIGYVSFLDLGVSRALTKLFAEKLGSGEKESIPSLVWTAFLLMLLMGFIGSIVLSWLVPWLVDDILKIPSTLNRETRYAFYLVALSLPVVISTAGLRGVLEAQQRFDLANAIRIPLGVFTFLGPLLILPYSHSLFAAVMTLLIARLVAWIVHLYLCVYTVPDLRRGVRFQFSQIQLLLKFGSWMSITNIIGPLMVNLDRFVIGSIISIAAVAYYSTPFEVVTKLLIIPSSLVGVLFPAFSAMYYRDPLRTSLLFNRGLKYVLLSVFPVSLFIITFSFEGLKIWLGPEFAQNGQKVLQWLGIGVFANSLAYVPAALIQGIGRPDLTAKLHLIELPFYIVVLYWFTSMWGIKGAAIVWTIRAVIDLSFLLIMAWRLLPMKDKKWDNVLIPGILAFITLFFVSYLSTIIFKIAFLSFIYFIFGITAWFLILAADEREYLLTNLKKILCFGFKR